MNVATASDDIDSCDSRNSSVLRPPSSVRICQRFYVILCAGTERAERKRETEPDGIKSQQTQ